ncbi:MAG: MFS transporter [Alphaproteobacteria bacterium]
MRHLFQKNGIFSATVLIGGLGYFVDVFDLILVGALRTPSLKELGVPAEQLVSTGLLITNAQLAGMILGGFLWGILGDKRGRMYSMYGSIILYSVASLLNGFVTSVDQYIVLRLLGGIGLAGEFGAAITLVCETLPKAKRSYATSILAAIGALGAVFATLASWYLDWRTCYILGGILGFILLGLRMKVLESAMFMAMAAPGIRQGDVRMLLTRSRFFRYVACVFLGLPVLFVFWFFGVFAPEIGATLGLAGPLNSATAMLCWSVMIAVGEIGNGFVAQWWQSRKKVIALSYALIALWSAVLLTLPAGTSPLVAYALYCLLGLACGYWVTANTLIAEQFGTNLRATVAVTSPNLVRLPLVVVTLSAGSFIAQWGVVTVGMAIAALFLAMAAWALWTVHETFGKDLNYIEK